MNKKSPHGGFFIWKTLSTEKKLLVFLIMNVSKYNLFLLSKLPISWIAGVRIKHLDEEKCITGVKLSWLSQNPFKSMFWAVQGMAAEFSTGIMCAHKIEQTHQKVSMLVVHQEAQFTKKAVGRITFSCNQGLEIDELLKKAIDTKQGQIIILTSTGVDEKGDQVAQFKFTWSFKAK